MRLTLRTMLACLDADDRLDPADVEDLSQKIQQSKYATDLAARIRRLVQHPRVGTLRLDAKGNGFDANSVSEYLDNTLVHEKIADFERTCIESDVRLAEVAACHQILVLVLEQPAEIEPTVRERMYQLGKESSRKVDEDAPISEARILPGGGSVRIDRPETTATVAKAAPEVPDYLRAGRRPSMWPLALAAVLAFVAVGVGLRLMGPLDRTHPMAKLVGASEAEPTIPVVEPPVEPALVPPPMPPINAEDTTKLPSEPVEVVPPVEPMPMPAVPVEPPVPVDEPMPEESLPVKPPVEVDPIPVKKPEPEKPVEPPQPPADVGRFVSEDQVLVRAEGDSFARVATRASIFAGDELIALPAYRPQLLFGNNTQLTIAGESRLAMGMTDASGVAHVDVDFGRFLAVSVAKANTRLALHLGGLEGVATFADVDSELAVEVRNWLPPGMNPETPNSTVRVIRLYVTRGKVNWQEGFDEDAKSFAIESGNVRNYLGEEPGETVALVALPDWVDGKNIADIDRRAAREVESKLTLERPLELSLREMASGSERRAEVRALAVRSLMLLNQFEPFLAAISDDLQRAYWTAEIEVIRDAITHSPEKARYIHDIFVKVRGEQDGTNLYRMLWGFSSDDLKNGLAEELVKSLDIELLDYRVLAFDNLRRITGSTQLYQPQFSEARRRTPVAQWRERLKAGEIVYKTPPQPIMDPKPSAGPMRSTETPLEP